MSEPVGLHDFHPFADPEDAPAAERPFVTETWREFEQNATEHVPVLVERLWPENALGFIAAPPKHGKTWVGLGLALSVATGRRFLDTFTVPAARPVLYLALEGHRAALRARVGCLARGLDIDPDGDQLGNLHFAYKPRGINIADPGWINTITDQASELEIALVIVDVLRAAAAMKENSNDEFNQLRRNVEPLLAAGASIGLLHHFGKLTDITRDRTPAERMAGAGAMYGALDVGIYITGSDRGARDLRLAFDTRDIASPSTHGVRLAGTGSGENGGFTYRDRAHWEEAVAPGEDEVDAASPEIVDWLRENGGEAREAVIAAVFGVSEKTIGRRRVNLERLGVDWVKSPGKPGLYRLRPEPTVEDFEQDELDFVTGHDKLVQCVRHGGQNGVSSAEPHGYAENGRTGQTQDTTPVRSPETTDLQGKHAPDTQDTPYGGAGADRPAATPGEPIPADHPTLPDDPDFA